MTLPKELYDSLKEESIKMETVYETTTTKQLLDERFDGKKKENVIEKDDVEVLLSPLERRRYQHLGAALFYEGAEILDAIEQEEQTQSKMRVRIVNVAQAVVKEFGEVVKYVLWDNKYMNIFKRLVLAVGLGIALFTDWFSVFWKKVKEWFLPDWGLMYDKTLNALLNYDYAGLAYRINTTWILVKTWFMELPTTIHNYAVSLSQEPVENVVLKAADTAITVILKTLQEQILPEDSEMVKLARFDKTDKINEAAFYALGSSANYFKGGINIERKTIQVKDINKETKIDPLEYAKQVKEFFMRRPTLNLMQENGITQENGNHTVVLSAFGMKMNWASPNELKEGVEHMKNQVALMLRKQGISIQNTDELYELLSGPDTKIKEQAQAKLAELIGLSENDAVKGGEFAAQWAKRLSDLAGANLADAEQYARDSIFSTQKLESTLQEHKINIEDMLAKDEKHKSLIKQTETALSEIRQSINGVFNIEDGAETVSSTSYTAKLTRNLDISFGPLYLRWKRFKETTTPISNYIKQTGTERLESGFDFEENLNTNVSSGVIETVSKHNYNTSVHLKEIKELSDGLINWLEA